MDAKLVRELTAHENCSMQIRLDCCSGERKLVGCHAEPKDLRD